jgi:pimeloyl-ACP methyl ester carboxylesterase
MTPILLLHGALGSESQLEPLKKMLKENGSEVYTMNFSGHSGKAFDTNGFGIGVFSKDVLSFIDLHQLKQVDIFGYSMGGYVALWFAFQNPQRVNRIVTLGTKFDWTPDSAEKEVRKMNPDKIIEKVPAFARILEHRHAPRDWKELMTKTATMMTSLGAKPLLTESEFKQLNHSVIITLGDQDDMADRSYSEKVAQWLPQGNFHLMQATPHPIEKVDLSVLFKLINT